mmetsp:Transcript_22479/g.26380  ORF Transcript_22479/g.26380 Transcript_22479/m.26380 type:complete len:82 (+) Transcript_22479:18-263(+)
MMLNRTAIALATAALFALDTEAKMTDAAYFYRTDRPLIVAHRGAFGHFPEESLPSWDDAYYGGADFLEMDLQITKDGQIVC